MYQHQANASLLRSTLQAMMSSLPNKDSVGYLEFFLIARQLNFRFETSECADFLRNEFLKNNDTLLKSQMLEAIEYRGHRIVNNKKIHVVNVKNPFPQPKQLPQAAKDPDCEDQKIKSNRLKKEISRTKVAQQASIMIRKMKTIQNFLEENYGKKNYMQWFKVFDIEAKGSIGIYELKWIILTMLGSIMNGHEIKILFHSAKKNRSGLINLEGFEELFDRQKLEERVPHSIVTLSQLNEESKTTVLKSEIKIKQLFGGRRASTSFTDNLDELTKPASRRYNNNPSSFHQGYVHTEVLDNYGEKQRFTNSSTRFFAGSRRKSKLVRDFEGRDEFINTTGSNFDGRINLNSKAEDTTGFEICRLKTSADKRRNKTSIVESIPLLKNNLSRFESPFTSKLKRASQHQVVQKQGASDNTTKRLHSDDESTTKTKMPHRLSTRATQLRKQFITRQIIPQSMMRDAKSLRVQSHQQAILRTGSPRSTQKWGVSGTAYKSVRTPVQ